MDVAEYLARIGASAEDDLATLTDRHYHAVPFENLSIHLGEPIDTHPDALFDKIVRRHRGGFCYELNGLFAALLAELGYDVAFLGARVHAGETDTAPLAHQALRVTGDDRVARLVDVGFGGFCVPALELAAPSTQVDPQPGGDVEVVGPDGGSGYRLDGREYARRDFGPTCWWTANHPDSVFTHGPTCTLPRSPAGRVTLAGHQLIRTAADGTRTEDELSDDEALAAYRDLFGIVLDRLPVPLHPGGASPSA
ncbi:arylamine N-acetyltransferase [Actinomycetospora sp. TBRC 11914]|uniref:arylamine N-acetyltransferase family protein n=1 Tax=Actinomycetospora sp. TBRC 11914 TaxID=2729387 RepID=UPI00145D303A|nr:arylamine N-acetyltransferase [Actinomycetospora sp. TBRC 11914]NMO92219.1 arylamine N-acetyltransferase [Actinomycetospora sp. TBRC 11914]